MQSNLYSIVLYLYIYIALHAVHTNQKHLITDYTVHIALVTIMLYLQQTYSTSNQTWQHAHRQILSPHFHHSKALFNCLTFIRHILRAHTCHPSAWLHHQHGPPSPPNTYQNTPMHMHARTLTHLGGRRTHNIRALGCIRNKQPLKGEIVKLINDKKSHLVTKRIKHTDRKEHVIQNN